jgi:hypothetical protein
MVKSRECTKIAGAEGTGWEKGRKKGKRNTTCSGRERERGTEEISGCVVTNDDLKSNTSEMIGNQYTNTTCEEARVTRAGGMKNIRQRIQKQRN